MKTIQDRTAALQQEIWSDITGLVQAGHDSPVTALFKSSINDIFDSNTVRIVLGAEFFTTVYRG